jgi:hypothetical protein|tara:strand:- start:1167 stop:1361 length:195 start_codon:yes stop_codon:yes gene_type:complete
MKKSKIPNPFDKVQHHPDARKHQIISFVKSGIRLIGYGTLLYNIETAVYILVLSEVIGIVEEVV